MLQLTNIATILSNKMQAFYNGAVDRDLYFAEVQIPTSAHICGSGALH